MNETDQFPVHYQRNTVCYAHKAEKQYETWYETLVCGTFSEIARKEEKYKRVQEEYYQRKDSKQHIQLANIL